MKNRLSQFALVLLFLVAANSGNIVVAQVSSSDDDAAVRHFHFIYSGAVANLPKDVKARVWLPIASTNDHQEILDVEMDLPGEVTQSKDSVYGNKMVYFEVTGDGREEVPFSIKYEVRRNEVNGGKATDSLSKSVSDLYLKPNKMVPIDGKPLDLINGMNFSTDHYAAGQSLYDCVEKYMTYDKSKPGYGNGDVMWACDSKTGNCTDFHSVFISLARSLKIPAYFEIGFPLPPERGEGKIGGYHCWANFFVDGKGWVPVDISEADKHPEMKDYYFGNLTENRIGFSKGRDINLKPKQDAPALNYFVYPHVEVNGEAWSRDNIKLNFRYQDSGANRANGHLK